MLTDNEIKKALECCGDEDIHLCSICPLYRENPHNDFCQEDLHKSALDLINRLQADKQNLEIELKAMRGAANSYKAENERLRESCSHIDICCKNCKYLIRYRGSAPLIAQCTKGHKDFLPFDVKDSIETYYCRGFTPFKFNTTNEAEIKAEAYKECITLIKKKSLTTHKNIGGICWYETDDKQLDNLYKELVGENNA